MANVRKGIERRTEMIRLKASPTEREVIAAAAAARGSSESDFIRLAINAELERMANPPQQSAA